jgi:hypothetical protein
VVSMPLANGAGKMLALGLGSVGPASRWDVLL